MMVFKTKLKMLRREARRKRSGNIPKPNRMRNLKCQARKKRKRRRRRVGIEKIQKVEDDSAILEERDE
jgi:hypothetical protein